MQCGHVAAVHRTHQHVAERRQHVVAENAAVELLRERLAVHRGVNLEVPVREVRHGGRRRGLGRLPQAQTRDDAGSALAGIVGGHGAVSAQGEARKPCGAARLR